MDLFSLLRLRSPLDGNSAVNWRGFSGREKERISLSRRPLANFSDGRGAQPALSLFFPSVLAAINPCRRALNARTPRGNLPGFFVHWSAPQFRSR